MYKRIIIDSLESSDKMHIFAGIREAAEALRSYENLNSELIWLEREGYDKTTPEYQKTLKQEENAKEGLSDNVDSYLIELFKMFKRYESQILLNIYYDAKVRLAELQKENSTFILTYPGIGVRTRIKESKYELIHTDAYGYFADDYWLWLINADYLRYRMREKVGVYIGWCANWRQLTRHLQSVGHEVYLYAPLNPQEYAESVKSYRSTPEYRAIDLNLLKRYHSSADRPIEWYVAEYTNFLNDTKMFKRILIQDEEV